MSPNHNGNANQIRWDIYTRKWKFKTKCQERELDIKECELDVKERQLMLQEYNNEHNFQLLLDTQRKTQNVMVALINSQKVVIDSGLLNKQQSIYQSIPLFFCFVYY